MRHITRTILIRTLLLSAWLAAGTAPQAAAALLAWGSNGYGKLEVPASAQSGVIAIAAGFYHTVALKAYGSVVAWGQNNYGQTNVPAAAQSGVKAIAAGDQFTVALKSDGSVLAWGRTNFNFDRINVPAAARSGVKAIRASGSVNTFALKDDGTVVAWGANNYFGQATVPVGLRGVTAVSAGANHTVVLVDTGPEPTLLRWPRTNAMVLS